MGRKASLDLKTPDAVAVVLKTLRGLGQIHATQAEAAAVLAVNESTLRRYFAEHPELREAFDDGRSEGKVSLRRDQFALSKKHPQMAIFLGKQVLGQRERNETEVIIRKLSLEGLSPAQLDALENALEAAGGLGAVLASADDSGAGAAGVAGTDQSPEG